MASWKSGILTHYLNQFDETTKEVAEFLRVILDDELREKLAAGLERFAKHLREKDGPIQ